MGSADRFVLLLRRHRRLTGAVVVAALAGALGLILRYLADTAAAETNPFPWLAPAVSVLVSVGARLNLLMSQHGWAVAAAVTGAAACAVTTAVRADGPARRRNLGAIGFCSLAALAMVFLAAQRISLAALAACLAALAFFAERRDETVDCVGATAPAGRSHRALLLVPVVLGLVLRVTNLATWLPGYAEHAAVHHAEISIPLYEGVRAGLLHGDRVWNTVVTDQHGPNSFVEALGFCVFGVNMTATRLTSAVLGAFTILLAYGVGARLAGRRAGLIFSFLLALAPWHISISRYEDTEHVLSPLQALATIYFLFGAIRRGRWRDFVGLGVSLGLSWYVYSPNQTLPLIVGAVVLAAILRPRSLVANRAARALVASACFVVVSLPAVTDFVHRGRALPVRSAYEDDADSRFLSPVRISRLAAGDLRQLFVAADDPWFGTQGGGLGLVSSVLLIPGLLLCAVRLGRPECRPAAALFLAGLPVALLPAVLAPDVSFRRLILFALLTVALSALVLDRVLEWFFGVVRSRTLVLAVVAVLAAVGVTTSAHAYFGLSHAYETESHRYQRAVASFVRAQLGRSYATIVAVHDWDVDDVRRYLTVAAYGTLSGSGWKDGANSRLCRVVKLGDLERAIADSPTIRGRGLLLAEQSLVREPLEGIDLRALVARRLPGARASVWHDPDGTEVFTCWEYEKTPGSARD